MLCYNTKNNFGDISFEAIARDNVSQNQQKYFIKWLPLTPNPENMPEIIFKSVENPNLVIEIAKEARKKILKSNNK